MWCSGVTAPRLMWPFLTWLMNWQFGYTLTGLAVYVLFVCVWCQFFKGRVHRRGDDLTPWVRSWGSRGRSKAERWSPSVGLAHGKVVITQDWLATSPLAPWLFLSLHFFCTLSLPQSLIFLPFAHPSLSTFQGCLLLSLLLSGISWANFHCVFFPHSATHFLSASVPHASALSCDWVSTSSAITSTSNLLLTSSPVLWQSTKSRSAWVNTQRLYCQDNMVL